VDGLDQPEAEVEFSFARTSRSLFRFLFADAYTAVKFSEMKLLTGGRADENTARNERIIIQWLSFDTRDNTNVR